MGNLIIIAGIIFIAIGTLITYLGTDLKSKKAAKQLEKSINSKNKQIDELVEGKDTVIQQNAELNQKIELYQKELEEKQKKIDELEKFAKKDIYRPLSEGIKNQIIQRLKSTKEKNIKKVLISSFDTNNNGKRVMNDLLELLKTAGIEASIERTGMSFGRGVSRHRVKMNQATVESAEYLCNILSVYLKTKYSGAVDDKLEDGVVDIELHGIPLFHEDGTVEFQ